MTECNDIKEQRRHNTGLAKVAVKCSADPEVSGWLIKVWFSASTFVVKIEVTAVVVVAQILEEIAEVEVVQVVKYIINEHQSTIK